MSTSIPSYLLDQIKSGNVILFFGAGASLECRNTKGETPPLAKDLAKGIANKFLNSSYQDFDLNYVSELAISESSMYDVQKYLYDIFYDFKPSESHRKIPLFRWHSIFTTNYDLAIEGAYSENLEKQQNLVKFLKNGQKINDAMRERDSLMFFKLHGCITEIVDENLPLILTTDQYIEYKKGRSNLFDRLEDFCKDHPVIFIGYGVADADIRATMKLISQNTDNQPRHYLVAPNITDEASRFWENRKVTPIKMKFSEFIEELSSKISPNERKLGFARDNQTTHPIESKFQSFSKNPTALLYEFVNNDVDYIHANLASTEVPPKLFYKGYFNGWDPILRNLDVKRKITDDILSEVFLSEENDRVNKQEFYLINGNAGAGKSIFLHRLAYDAGTNFNSLCLVYKSDSSIDYNRINEIFELCNERIFLFVERVHERIDEIIFILNKSKRDNLPITIIGTERTNIWNTLCENLLPFVGRIYTLSYLNDGEISNLIDLLEKHKSLGYLTHKSRAEQIDALSEKTGRELLVALYEATAGKNLSDIVMDEYKNIPNEEAQRIYLTICTFHRIGTYTRAGNLSRLHNINFSYFKENLFRPLESVVYDRRDYRINDYVFVSRHPYIAEMVFEQVLVNEEDRYNKYIDILSHLDVDYESDLLVFKDITNARKLMEIFKDGNKIRSLYAIARSNIGSDPFLLQQESIFEMKANDGDFSKSEELLDLATEISPDNIYFHHTKAELNLKKAERTDNEIIRNQLIKKTKEISSEIIQTFKNKNINISSTYHTLLKTYLFELKLLLKDNKADLVDKKVQDFEKTFNLAIQEYPEESFLLDAESKFNDMLSNSPAALESLEKAFKINQSSPYIATRLANYHRNSDPTKTKEILEIALGLNQYDKNLNFLYSKLLIDIEPEDYVTHRHYLRNSFVKNDKRYEAQFWFARCLYLLGEKEDAKKFFSLIKNAPIDNRFKKNYKGIVVLGHSPKVFDGVIIKLERSYGFVKENITGETIYFERDKNKNDELTFGKNISFNKIFNYYGVNAIII